MKRREFFGKTGGGIAGILASRFGFGPVKTGKSAENNLIGQPADFKTIRKDFPPLSKITYLDTAFVGLMSRQVKSAHETFLEDRLQFSHFGSDRSILGIWMSKMEDVRSKLALFLGAESDEVAFTLCTGCGSNIAINGMDWQRGDNVIIDDLEYPTDFHILNSLKKKGVEVRIVRHKNGYLAPENFAALADRRTRAFVVTHVSYLNGFRHDLKKLAEIIHSFGGYLIVDAAQSIGGIKVNVKEENVDFMSGIPYKWLNGPNGVGFLYVRKDIINAIEPDRLGWASIHDFKSLATMESNPLPENARRFEYGTLGFEGIYALDTALDYINQIGIEAIEEHNLMLTRQLRNGLSERGVEFFTPENNQSPILAFFIEDEKKFGKKMKENNIQITARRWGRGQVRISPHFYNSESDIEAFFDGFDSTV